MSNTHHILLGLYAFMVLSRVAGKQCDTARFPVNTKQFVCYWRGEGKKNWHDAWLSCIKDGGSLPVLISLENADFMRNVNLIDTDIWLGLTDSAVQGVYRWVDGTALSKFEMWERDQPDNTLGKEDCVGYGRDARNNLYWYDYDCQEERDYVCQSLEMRCKPDKPECATWVHEPLPLVPRDMVCTNTGHPDLFEINIQGIICHDICKWATHFICLGVHEGSDGTCRGTGVSLVEMKRSGCLEQSTDGTKLYMRDRVYAYQEEAVIVTALGQGNPSWETAQQLCTDKGPKSKLVIIETEGKNWQLGDEVTWIALSDEQSEGTWYWQIGTGWLDLLFPEYTNWETGHPNGGKSKNCAFRKQNGKWVAKPCVEGNPVFCQEPCIETSSKPVAHYQFADNTIITI